MSTLQRRDRRQRVSVDGISKKIDVSRPMSIWTRDHRGARMTERAEQGKNRGCYAKFQVVTSLARKYFSEAKQDFQLNEIRLSHQTT
jgi:hypothetical protein